MWDSEVMDALRDGFPDMSDRQRQNRLAMIAAIQRLQEAKDQRYATLLSDETSSVSVLAELGRIDDPLTFVDAVEWWLAERPKVKEAVTVIRRMRTGKVAPGSARGLHAELVDAINGYLNRHPATSPSEILEALELTRRSASRSG